MGGGKQSHSQLAFSFIVPDQLAPPRIVLHHVVPPVPLVIYLTICGCHLMGWTPSKVVKVHVPLPRLLIPDLEGKLDTLGEEVKLKFCEFDDAAQNQRAKHISQHRQDNSEGHCSMPRKRYGLSSPLEIAEDHRHGMFIFVFVNKVTIRGYDHLQLHPPREKPLFLWCNQLPHLSADRAVCRKPVCVYTCTSKNQSVTTRFFQRICAGPPKAFAPRCRVRILYRETKLFCPGSMDSGVHFWGGESIEAE